jgi:hypothetical protein
MREFLRLAILSPLVQLRRILSEADLRASDTCMLHEFRVINTSDRVSSPVAFAAVEAALDVLHTHDARLLRSIRRVMPRIAIAAQSGSVYWSHVNVCALSDMTIQRQPPAWVASVVVHESVHARLWRRGVRTTAANRARVESSCINQQQQFLSRIPGTEAWIEHLENELADGTWYEPEARKRAIVDRLVALETPQWIVRLFAR